MEISARNQVKWSLDIRVMWLLAAILRTPMHIMPREFHRKKMPKDFNSHFSKLINTQISRTVSLWKQTNKLIKYRYRFRDEPIQQSFESIPNKNPNKRTRKGAAVCWSASKCFTSSSACKNVLKTSLCLSSGCEAILLTNKSRAWRRNSMNSLLNRNFSEGNEYK